MKSNSLLVLSTLLAAVGCRGGEPAPSSGAGEHATQEASAGEPRAQAVSPAQVERVPVADARRLVQAGDALLVCAYDSDERYQQVALDGSISHAAFEQRLPSLPRDTEVIFYCA